MTGIVAVTSPAAAAKPTGSAVELLLSNDNRATAITSGTWGPQLWAADGTASGAAAFGCQTGDILGQAFVPASSNGSTEEPVVPSDATVASEVYQWTRSTAYTPYSEFDPTIAINPIVSATSTQLATNDQQVAILAGQTPTPAIVRLRQQWPAGTLVSLVEFCSPGIDSVKKQPIVRRDANGRAIASWLTFRTVASSTNPAYTSSDFVIIAPVTPTIPLDAVFSDDRKSGTLTAQLTDSAGTPLTDAKGSVAFYAGSTTTGTPFATDDSVVDGVATVPLSSLTPGSTVSYTAVYTPDATQLEKYASGTSDTATFDIPALSTTTTLAVTGSLDEGSTQTLTASVVPAAATGTVKFLDGASVLGEKAVAAGSAQLTTVLGVGGHTLTAQFVPASTQYTGSVSGASSATVTAAQVTTPVTTPPVTTAPPVITPPVTTPPAAAKAVAKSAVKVSKSKAVVKKTVLKATITLTVPGTKTKPTGKVVITVNGKKVKTVTVTTSNKGKVTVTLPKFTKVSAKTKVVASYAGTATIAAATSKTVTVKVTAK